MALFRRARRLLLVPIILAALGLTGVSGAAAAPDGTLTIVMHFTPVTRWLDPAEGESTITPFLLLYALHDGLLKPHGDPVTADDVKFSFERYRGGGAKVLKDNVKEIQTPAPPISRRSTAPS